MFAKRQPPVLAAAASSGRFPALNFAGLTTALKKPPIAAGAAGALLLLTSALFILVLGDPRAGTPSARAALERAPAQAADIPTGLEAFSLDAYGPYADAGAVGPDGQLLTEAAGGSALITLPDGTTIASPTAVAGPRRPPAQPLPAAPLQGLTQPGPNGPLPVIAPDGRVPAQAYARPFRPDGRPRVALIVGGLGLNAVTTRAAIERLPAEITLSFVPYAEGLQGWIDLARANGHEVMIEIPMEPTGYPENDPGPYTLLTSGAPEDIQSRMSWLLGRATGYFGVTNYLGDRFAQSDAGMNAFLGTLRQRGISFVDDGSMGRRPGAWARASADRIVDEVQTPAAVVAQLNALEAAAKTRGSALGSGFSYPVTVEAASRWADGLSARGVQLAPASAMTQRPGR